MLKDIKKIKDKVGFILKEYPQTRDCDKLLWLAYLSMFHDLKNVLGENNYSNFKNLILSKKTPSTESIRRVRQKYQEKGEYVGNGRPGRKAESENVKSYMKST